jgi:hypothetical protein
VAFRYFDRNNTGFLRTEHIETILHGLGNSLSRGYVQDLIATACDSRESSYRIFYLPLIKAVTAAAASSTPAREAESPVRQPVIEESGENAETKPDEQNLPSIGTTTSSNMSSTALPVPKIDEQFQEESHELTMDEGDQQ